jgi:flagellar hook-associated protein 2
VSSSSSGLGSSSTTYGTNVAPISFPGIVSGIDYNSIISKLTELDLAPNKELNTQIATLNNANVELVKINNLLASVQSSLVALSNPSLFDTYQAASSSSSVLANGITGVSASPGLYTIESVKTATNTSVLSSANAGHSITDKLTSGPYAGDNSNTVPLIDSYASLTPSDGTNGSGQVTVDGVAISYNVNAQSLDTILSNITAQVDSKADAHFLATLVNGVVQFTSSDQSISLGSSNDSGNLLSVLKLSNAQLLNSGTSGSVSGTSNVGGINAAASFNSTSSAGFVTPVTAGTFTINGVKIAVKTDENLDDVINAINSSSAGVTASLNAITGQIELTNQSAGSQSIIIGASSDTSNFLSAAGLTPASGAKTTVGQQSAVTVLNNDGTTSTFYNNSNTVSNVIPGISLNLTTSTTQPFTVNVTQNSNLLVSAIQGFVSTYNKAINEINSATTPPIVIQGNSTGKGPNASSIPGGVLYGNSNVQQITQQLEDIVGGFLGQPGSKDYNSLSQVGLQLDSSFSTVQAQNPSSANFSSNPVQAQTEQGTDGQLQALNVSTFLAAYLAKPAEVKDLLVGANSLTTQLGSYLTTVTGNPTLLDSGTVGTIPSVSLIQNFENNNNDTVATLGQQVQQITDSANAQANALRSEFVQSESTIAGLQAEQQQLAAVFGFSTSSSSSSS